MKSVTLTCVFALFLVGTWQVMDARQKRMDAKLHLMAQSQLAMNDRLESLEDRHDALLKAVCGDEMAFAAALSKAVLDFAADYGNGKESDNAR